MVILKKFFRQNILILIVIILSLTASHSLFHSGLIPTHDGEYHVIRFFEFDKTFRGEDLYPRWAPDLNNGFGLPLFNYVYPFPNYVALILHGINFSFIDSFKISLVIASMLGSIFMYLWAKEFWGGLGGIISSVFYTYSPYHFLDIYVRGSVGEVWALAFFPAFLWSVKKFTDGKESKYFILSAIFLSLIILSHNILSLMFFTFVVFYLAFILFVLKKNLFKQFLLIILLPVGITAIFWLPAIFERGYVRGLEIYDYSSNFPEFYQLIFPSWGTGFSSDPLQNQLSFQIGIANLLAVLGTLVILLKDEKKRILGFFLVSFLTVFFMMLKNSLPVWKVVPLFNYLQFPWRFLSLEILFASFMAGSLIRLGKPKIVALCLIILAVFLGIGYSNVAYYLERSDNYYTTRSNFIDGTNSSGNTFNTIWMKALKKEKERLAFLKGEGVIKQEKQFSNYYSFKVKTSSDAVLKANIAYFPNWTVYIDGQLQKISLTDDGLFSFNLPKGNSEITLRFEDTPIRTISMIISVLSLLVLFVVLKFVKIIR